MAKVDRFNGIPILYTRGTHYEVGLDIVSIQITILTILHF